MTSQQQDDMDGITPLDNSSSNVELDINCNLSPAKGTSSSSVHTSGSDYLTARVSTPSTQYFSPGQGSPPRVPASSSSSSQSSSPPRASSNLNRRSIPYNTSSSSSLSSLGNTPPKSPSSFNIEAYEQRLLAQKAAITERNEIISSLTTRLKDVVTHYHENLEEKSSENSELQMELLRLKEKQMKIEEKRAADRADTMALKNRVIEAETQSSLLQEQLETLTNNLSTVTHQLSQSNERYLELQNIHRETQDKFHSFRVELSETKTQLIWANEELEQYKARFLTQGNELNMLRQDFQLKCDCLNEANARLEKLKKFEVESVILHRSIANLKEELNESHSAFRSLQEEKDEILNQLQTLQNITMRNETISDQTQYMAFPETSFSPIPPVDHNLPLPQNIIKSIEEIMSNWPQADLDSHCGTLGEVIELIKHIREYVRHGRLLVENELKDVLKEGEKIESITDVVGIIQCLKAHAMQGRALPQIEEEVKLLKVHLADAEAKLHQRERELERLQSLKSSKPMMKELQRVKDEKEAELMQQIYALQSENIQLLQKKNLLEQQASNQTGTLSMSPSLSTAVPLLGIVEDTAQIEESCQTEISLLHDNLTQQQAIDINFGSPQRCLLDITDDIHLDNNAAVQTTPDSPESDVANLLMRKNALVSSLQESLTDVYFDQVSKLLEIIVKLHLIEKNNLQTQMADKALESQKQAEELMEMRYLEQMETLTKKWELDKNNELHKQAMKFILDLSEPMSIETHLRAVKAIIEADIFAGLAQMNELMLHFPEESPDLNADATNKDAGRLYEQLKKFCMESCNSVEAACTQLMNEINGAKTSLLKEKDMQISELEDGLALIKSKMSLKENDLKNIMNDYESELKHKNKALKTIESLEAEVEATHEECAKQVAKVEKILQTFSCASVDELSGVLDELKSCRNKLREIEECLHVDDQEEAVYVLKELSKLTESGGVSFAVITSCLRNRKKVGDHSMNVLTKQLTTLAEEMNIGLPRSNSTSLDNSSNPVTAFDDSQALPSDRSVLLDQIERVQEEKQHLIEQVNNLKDVIQTQKEDFDNQVRSLQQRLDELQDISMTSVMEALGECNINTSLRLSDSLLGLVSELRKAKTENKKLQSQLEETLNHSRLELPKKSPHRLYFNDDDTNDEYTHSSSISTLDGEDHLHHRPPTYRTDLEFAQQTNQRLLSIVSDLVNTCVSSEQEIQTSISQLKSTSGLEIVPLLERTNNSVLICDEEPPISLSSTLNGNSSSRDDCISLSFINGGNKDENKDDFKDGDQDMNDLQEDILEVNLASIGSLTATMNHPSAGQQEKPEEDMVLVPARRLKASVSHMVEYTKASQATLVAKVGALEEKVETLTRDLQDEEKVRSELTNQLAAAKEKVISLEESREKLIRELETLSHEQHTAEHALEALKFEKQRLENAIDSLRHENDVITQQSTSLRESRSDLEQSASKDPQDLEKKRIPGELLSENARLEKEKHSLSRSCEREIALRDQRISALEAKLEDIVMERDIERERRINEASEKDSQLEAMERQLMQNKKFLEEISQEKDQEQEQLEKEIKALKETLMRERNNRVASDEARLQREHLELVEVELSEKRKEMTQMAEKRSELETELRNALDRIEDLKDVINRLESDITSREDSNNALTKQLVASQLPVEALRSLSPASESTSEQISEGTQHDMEMSFKIVKEQLRAKESELRKMENLQSLLQELSSRIRMLNERTQSVITNHLKTQKTSMISNELGICEEEPDLFSPNSSVQISLVNTLERNIEKIVAFIKNDSADELEALRQEVIVLKGVNEDLLADLYKKSTKLTNLECALTKERCKEDMNAVRVTFNQHESVVIEMRAQIEVLKGQIETLTKEKTQAKESLKRKSEDIKSLQQRIKRLESMEDLNPPFLDRERFDTDNSASSSGSIKSSPDRIKCGAAIHHDRNEQRQEANMAAAYSKQCSQCVWMQEELHRQELEVRKLRSELFEKSIAKKSGSVCSSDMSSSPECTNLAVQTSFHDSSLNRELQEEILQLKSDKELLEHRKGVYEKRCITLQEELDKLKDELQNKEELLSGMIEIADHEKQMESLRVKMLNETEREITSVVQSWQEKVQMEKDMSKRIMEEKEQQICSLQNSVAQNVKEKEYLLGRLESSSAELRKAQQSLSSKEHYIQKLKDSLEETKEGAYEAVRHVGDKMKSKMDELVTRCKNDASCVKDINLHLERVVSMLAQLAKQGFYLDENVRNEIIRYFESKGEQISFEWMGMCPRCGDGALIRKLENEISFLKTAASEEAHQRKEVFIDTELITLLHNMYWMYRNTESKRQQLIVQKNYLKGLPTRLEPTRENKKSFRHAGLVIIAIYRMKMRMIRWAKAAVVTSDRSQIIHKVSPHVQKVPTMFNVKTLASSQPPQGLHDLSSQ